VHLAAGEGDGAAVGLVDARDDLDQRRLAGAVVTDERDDLSRRHVEMDVGEGAYGAEALADPFEPEHRLPRRGLVLLGHRRGHAHLPGGAGAEPATLLASWPEVARLSSA
jgi:hypothetical protein